MIQRRTTVCLEGWYYLAVMGFILAGSLLREINLLLALFTLMLGPILVHWQFVRRSLRQVLVRRDAPKQLQAGDPLVVEVQATNARRRGTSWAVVVQDRLQRMGGGASENAHVLFSSLPPGEAQFAGYSGRVSQRGQYRLGPLEVSSRFPLGLLRHAQTHEEYSTLVVYPRLGKLTSRWHERQRRAYHGSRSVKLRQGLLEGDFHGLRDYRRGDSRNWIHWRTSARLGELTVRQFEQQQSYDLALFLDLWLPRQHQQEHLENVELAVSFAASVVADHCRRGSSFLVLGIAGQKVEFTRGPASMMLLDEMMNDLALAAASHEDLLPELLDRGLEQVPSRGEAVLVSTRPADLADTQRFAKLWSDTRKRTWTGRMLRLDASGDEFLTFFRPQ